MVASEWVQWIIAGGLIALLIALVFVAWWALFSDRARDRRRCPRCWYELTYSESAICTECGFTPRSEKDLTRTRRRSGVALLAIIGGTAIGLFVVDRANLRGWTSYVPNTVLLRVLPLADRPYGQVITELDQRLRDGVLSDRQRMSLLRRCVYGDRDARPPGDRWYHKYGELTMRWSGMVTQGADRARREAIEGMLLDIPPRVEFTTRGVWPAGVAPTLDVSVREWWPSDAHLRIIATPDLPDAVRDVHERRRNPIQRRSYSIRLPALESGRHEVPVKLEFDRRMDGGDAWERVGTHTVTVPVLADGTIEQTLLPVTGPAFEEVMRGLVPGIVKYQEGSLSVRVEVRPRRTFVEMFDDTAIGVRVDVLRNGTLARQLDIWWAAGTAVSNRQYAWEVPMLDDEVLGAPASEDDEWTVRVRGLPELALRVDGATRYWSGNVTTTVPARLIASSAPSRGWIPSSIEKKPGASDPAGR